MDSSQDSKFALKWAARELCRPGDIIHVAHCVPYLPVGGGVYAMPDGRLAMVDLDQVLASEEQYMMVELRAVQEACAEALQQQQVPYVVDILREEPLGAGSKGRVADALCRKADELQACALVIASQVKSGLTEFVLGSVAAHCTAHCRRPVLVLHASKAQPTGRTSAWQQLAGRATSMLGGSRALQQAADEEAAEESELAVSEGNSSTKPGRSIVLAVDDSVESERACMWAMDQLYRPGDTFQLLRIVPNLPPRVIPGDHTLDGMVLFSPGGTDLTSAFKSAAEHCMQHRFEPKLQAAGVPYKVNIIVEAVDETVSGIGDAICAKAEELQAAVVVMASHMHGGLLQFILGSVADHVAHHCKQPVAVLH